MARFLLMSNFFYGFNAFLILLERFYIYDTDVETWGSYNLTSIISISSFTR